MERTPFMERTKAIDNIFLNCFFLISFQLFFSKLFFMVLLEFDFFYFNFFTCIPRAFDFFIFFFKNSTIPS